MSRELDFYQKPQPFDEHFAAYLPYVRSTHPFDNDWTSSRSSKAIERYCPRSNRLVANVHFAPPAYVVGIIAHSPSSAQREIARDRKWQHLLATRASSMPWQSPSTSAAWMRNSLYNPELLAPFRHRIHTCNIAIEDPTILLMHIVKRPC